MKNREHLEGAVRPVRLSDCETLQSIYAPFVTDTAANFELVPPTVEEFRGRVEDVIQSHPWFVFESEGNVLGYAYGSKHRARPAYQWTSEVSIYVKPSAQGLGIGKALYRRLLETLRELGYRVALGGISLPNVASVALHESMGFVPVGVYRNVGFKFGEWHDTGWWQIDLAPESSAPAGPPRKFLT